MVFQMRVFNIRSILTIFLAVSIISLYSMSGSAFAQEGMSVTASSERNSSTIDLSGKTTKSGDLTLIVTAPNGNVVSIDQISPGVDGYFNTVIQVGPLWTQDGFYTLDIQQRSLLLHSFSLEVEVVGGIVLTSEVSDSSLLTIVPGQTPAGQGKLTMFADAVEGSTVIGISGHTTSTLNAITITVTAPNGNLVSIDQISPGINGNFETEITTGGPLWKQDGFYTVTAQQGGSSSFFKESVRVEIVDGLVIPEFGTIAALILAVAIISIVVVSARSRLSIMPKY